MFVRAASAVFGLFLVAFAAGVPASAQTSGLTVNVRSGILGWEGISVTGTAPANSEVLLDVSERISYDLPTISVGRYRTIANASGAFFENIAVAPAYVQYALVTVRAEAGGTAVSATATYRAPNADFHVPDWDDTNGN